MILPDTNVWIEFFKNKTPYLQIMSHHLKSGNVCTVGVVFAELLQGAKSQVEADRILRFYNSIPLVDESGLAIEAGLTSYSAKALAKGVGILDLMIVMAARRRQVRIWSLDKNMLALLQTHEKFHAKK